MICVQLNNTIICLGFQVFMSYLDFYCFIFDIYFCDGFRIAVHNAVGLFISGRISEKQFNEILDDLVGVDSLMADVGSQ